MSERPSKGPKPDVEGHPANNQRDNRSLERIAWALVGAALTIWGLAIFYIVTPDIWNRHNQRPSDWVMAAFTATLVAITGRYVAVTHRQWRAMEESLALSRKANALTLRSWIVLISLDKYWFTETNSGHHVLGVTIANVGKLPAVNVSVRSCYDVFPSDSINWPVTADESGGDDDDMIIDTPDPRRIEVLLRLLDSQRVAQIRNGIGVLAVSVEITYTDGVESAGRLILDAWWHHQGGWVYRTYKSV